MEKKPFIKRLQEAYEKTKKILAYIIVVSIMLIEALSKLTFIESETKNILELALIIPITLIIMEVLFHIYDKIVADKGHLKQINSNSLYDEILNLVKSNKNVKIQCIGVAGRYGWYSVIKRLLDRNNQDSLHEANKFDIEIALISPKFLEKNKIIFEKYEALIPIIHDIQRNQEVINNQYKNENKKINLYLYEHMPNFVGFLINDNYLFLNMCFWEETENGELDFRGAGTNYLIYDLNDDFGGSQYVKRFKGWFEFIKQKQIKQK